MFASKFWPGLKLGLSGTVASGVSRITSFAGLNLAEGQRIKFEPTHVGCYGFDIACGGSGRDWACGASCQFLLFPVRLRP